MHITTRAKKRVERRDSITESILQEREDFMAELQKIAVEKEAVKALLKSGLGSRKRLTSEQWTLVGAQGGGIHLASAKGNWPRFKHLLPEIAFAGHTNCGKSSLVNALVGAMAGASARHSVARVSDRAGWTDMLCFFQMGKKPPLFYLVDTPGYGHAVAGSALRSAWDAMMGDYLDRRRVLSKVAVLVDCGRGLCAADRRLLRRLEGADPLGPWGGEVARRRRRRLLPTAAAAARPYMVVLTKADLLPPLELAQIPFGWDLVGVWPTCLLFEESMTSCPNIGSWRGVLFARRSISLVSMQIEEVRHQAHEELRAKKAAQQQQSNIVVEVHHGGATSCHSPAPPSPPSGPANNTTFSTTSDIRAPIEVVPVCARSGAGIQDLWRRLCKVQLP